MDFTSLRIAFALIPFMTPMLGVEESETRWSCPRIFWLGLGRSAWDTGITPGQTPKHDYMG